MSLPRQILPGRFYMITRRCLLRMLLLRPDAETNNLIIYCLGEAAKRFGIEVILPSFMSNHHHTIVFDRYGRIVEFVQRFHRMVAKAMNVRLGRGEILWSSEQTSLVQLVDRQDVIAKLVYAATNPVKDGLVEQVEDWPGVNGLAALLTGRPLKATRPTWYFRKGGKMPAEATLELTIPPELGDAAAFRREVKEQVEREVKSFNKERRRAGRQVMGRAAVLRQPWSATPRSSAPRGGLRPSVAARSVWSRVEALARNRAFIDAYRVARKAWLAGEPAIFPAGTYWLAKFVKVPTAPATA